MDDLFQIGIVTSAHGLKGEVKVFPTTDDIHRFKNLKYLQILEKEGLVPYTIEEMRLSKNLLIFKLLGIDQIDEAMKLKNKKIMIQRKNAIPLSENEYFHKDLINLNVYTEEGEYIGILEDIIETSANDVYSVILGKQKILIPAIRQCIVSVDKEKMIVHLLKGLRDL